MSQKRNAEAAALMARMARIAGRVLDLGIAAVVINPWFPIPKVHTQTRAVILSETGPKRFSVSGVPKERSSLFGAEVGGGESKNLRLHFVVFYKNFQGRPTRSGRLRRA